MNLSSSSLNLESARKIWYALDFDPIDNVYKLLKVSSIHTPKVTKFSDWYNSCDDDHQTSLWNKITIHQKYFDEATPIGNFPSGELLLVCFERQKMEGTFFTYDAITKKLPN